MNVKCSLAHGWDIEPPCCGEPCLKEKSCGNGHVCTSPCHSGSCEPCSETVSDVQKRVLKRICTEAFNLLQEIVLCYCGATEKQVSCGFNNNDAIECQRDMGEEIVGEDQILRWTGRFKCDGPKDFITYDCGIHSIEVSCQPPLLKTPTCPTSPAVIDTCPCGQTPLSDLETLPRTKCTDPIPTCQKRCSKTLDGCDDQCDAVCHIGNCPKCTVEKVITCRCGESTTKMLCFEAKQLQADFGEEGFVCQRVCRSLRSCGRHECGRVCCPLSYEAGLRKGKKRENAGLPANDEDSPHACPL